MLGLSSSLEVLQIAMPLIGAKPPATMDDRSAESVAARAYYETLVSECMSRHSWSWCKKSEALTYAGEVTIYPKYKYTLPADLLTPRRIEIGGIPFKEWELKATDGERPAVYTDLKDTSALIMIYNYRAPEAVWPPGFITAVVHMLAGYLATGLLDRPAQGEALTAQGERYLRREMRKDRNSFPGGDTDPDPILVQAWKGSTAWADPTRTDLAKIS